MKRDTLKVQRAIYDGEDGAYVPIYADLKTFKAHLKTQVDRAQRTGRFGTSLKAIRNAKELSRLGLKPGQRVLDAGCGGGILINQLVARFGVQGSGVDLSTLALARAKAAGRRDIEYRQGVLQKLPFPAKRFDAVVSFDVLEHVEEKEAAIAEIMRVLKPGGQALLYAISKRDTFTWHWWLRFITFGRRGHDLGAGHHPDLMADPLAARELFQAAGARVLRLSYMHSFFTLMADEAIFGAQERHLKAMRRTGKGPPATPASGGGKAYAVLTVLEPVLNFLEWPWKMFGLSNGFFILVQKP